MTFCRFNVIHVGDLFYTKYSTLAHSPPFCPSLRLLTPSLGGGCGSFQFLQIGTGIVNILFLLSHSHPL